MFSKIHWLLAGLLCLSSLWATEEHGSKGLLDLHPGLAFWTIVTFAVLLYILKKFAWKPILESLDIREKYIAEKISHAEKSHEEGEHFLEETRQKLNSAQNEARNIVEGAAQRATQIRQESTVQTEKECTQIKIHAQRQIQGLQTKAMEDVLGNLGDLSVQIAGRILEKSLSQEEHSRLIQESLRSMHRELHIP